MHRRNSTPLAAAFSRPGWFNVSCMLALSLYFGFQVHEELATIQLGGRFNASAACLHVLARRDSAAVVAGPVVRSFGLLNGSCPLLGTPVAAKGNGSGSVCISFAPDAVQADGYYFVTLGEDGSTGLDPVRHCFWKRFLLSISLAVTPSLCSF